MHTLVTGGTGFIGRALVRDLRAQGHHVTVLTRNVARAKERLPGGVDVIRDPAAIPDEAIPDAVVNLAGENLGLRRWNEARKQAFVDSRVGTTRRIVEWMKLCRPRPRVLVSGSAVGYYGARGDEALTEESPPGNEYQSDLCRLWEEEAVKGESLGVRVCRIRLGIVLGPDGGPLSSMLTPFRLGLGGWLGSGGQWMPWIHRADVTALVSHLIGSERASGAYNATSPTPTTNRQFSKTLGRVLRRPVLAPIPAFVVRIMIGEMSRLMLTGQKVLPARAQAEGFAFKFSALEAALRDVLAKNLVTG